MHMHEIYRIYRLRTSVQKGPSRACNDNSLFSRYGKSGDLFPSIRLATLKGKMLQAESRSGFGVKMWAVEENEELEDIEIQMEALRRSWRRWISSPTSYNWHREEATWTAAVEAAEKGGEGAVKKILQSTTTRYRWTRAADHGEDDGSTSTDTDSDASSGSGKESPPPIKVLD